MFELRVAVGREPSGIAWPPRLAPIRYTFLRYALESKLCRIVNHDL